jgi:hypothetical protein
MGRLNPKKLHVRYLTGTPPDELKLPRRYTLTHSDKTGELFLTIGREYDKKQISGLYTRLMRDEVLAELIDDVNNTVLKVYCHVNGGFVFGTAGLRNRIFRTELPLALEAIIYGDRALFEKYPALDRTPIYVCFESTCSKYNITENWGDTGNHRL